MLSDIKTRQLKMSQLQSQIEEQSTLITKYEATVKQLQEQVDDCVNSHPAEIARLHAELQKYRDKEEKAPCELQLMLGEPQTENIAPVEHQPRIG